MPVVPDPICALEHRSGRDSRRLESGQRGIPFGFILISRIIAEVVGASQLKVSRAPNLPVVVFAQAAYAKRVGEFQ